MSVSCCLDDIDRLWKLESNRETVVNRLPAPASFHFDDCPTFRFFRVKTNETCNLANINGENRERGRRTMNGSENVKNMRDERKEMQEPKCGNPDLPQKCKP